MIGTVIGTFIWCTHRKAAGNFQVRVSDRRPGAGAGARTLVSDLNGSPCRRGLGAGDLPLAPQALVVELMAPDSAPARQILRCYLDEIVSRYYRRQATAEEVDAAIRENPSDDLALPHGAFLVVHQDHAVWGCAGLRFHPDHIGEVKRLFCLPAVRGRGLGSRLIEELENLAREHDLGTLRLDTRRDLVEARQLYPRLGYQEVAAFNDNPYADHWFVKTLS